MNTPDVPPKTAAKLIEPTSVGNRHKTALDIAISLIGSGFSPQAVWQNLRDKFDAQKTDKELTDIVAYAVGINPQPCTPTKPWTGRPTLRWTPPEPRKRSPKEHTDWWLAGFSLTQEQFVFRSQIAIPVEPRDQLRSTLEFLYTGPEFLNIVCQFEEIGGKARPKGPGQTISRDKWLEYVAQKGVPFSKAGAWFRPNPCQSQGSGAGGAITDSDVASFRFLLVESDVLPLETQLALFAKLNLPIAAVTLSGAVSAHAWIRLDAPNAQEYDRTARRILTAFEPFGIDQANKNPSRLSRLPGAHRTIGGIGDGEQALLWLNPGRTGATPADLEAFERSLSIPCVEEKPFRRLILEAIPRYEELIRNKGKLGVPTGIATFDRVSGGLKPGGYTLIAAATGVGKSTLGVNIINAALKSGCGVVLFSLEMSREDVTDMMFSINAEVDRNHYNTGEITDQELARMASETAWMQDLPLWVYDDPAMTIDGIRGRVLSLVSEQRIKLAVVDYAQLALTDERMDNREQAVAQVALALRLLSREANIAIVVLSQLNDDGRVRESRKLTHEASTVIMMERQGLSDPAITLVIAKGRKIPANPIQVYLKAEFCRIREQQPVAADVPPSRRYPD